MQKHFLASWEEDRPDSQNAMSAYDVRNRLEFLESFLTVQLELLHLLLMSTQRRNG